MPHAEDAETLDRLERQLRRLAFDLHDGPMQSVAAARLQASVCVSLAVTSSAAEACLELSDHLDAALAELHGMARGLRPPALDAGAFDEMLRSHIGALEEDSGLDIHVSFGADVPVLSASARIALFRIVQEALNNTLGHACANHADVSVRRVDGAVECEVADDGCGFDPGVVAGNGHACMGLRGMQERAELLGGELHVHSREGGGTRIVVRIPLWT